MDISFFQKNVAYIDSQCEIEALHSIKLKVFDYLVDSLKEGEFKNGIVCLCHKESMYVDL